jgi:hypothetical protein
MHLAELARTTRGQLGKGSRAWVPMRKSIAAHGFVLL